MERASFDEEFAARRTSLPSGEMVIAHEQLTGGDCSDSIAEIPLQRKGNEHYQPTAKRRREVHPVSIQVEQNLSL